MKRREFITLLGGAAAGWPFGRGAAANAEGGWVSQSWMTGASPAFLLEAFREGLKEASYIEGKNVSYRIPLGCGDTTMDFKPLRPIWLGARVAAIAATRRNTISAQCGKGASDLNHSHCF